MIRKNEILEYIRDSGKAQASSDVHDFLVSRKEEVSLVTVKRELSELEKEGLLAVVGAGRTTAYEVSTRGLLLLSVDAKKYSDTEPDTRKGRASFNFEIFSALTFDPFTEEENKRLNEATTVYREQTKGLTSTLQEKELERFVIELSWKSSKIEGNTYTLLDTERLLKEGIPASGHPKEEATMILNHKTAFQSIYAHKEHFKTISLAKIEEVHKILVKDLHVTTNIRSKMVGVTGSTYRPLDVPSQITEAVEALCGAVEKMPSVYAKALIVLMGLSYIQPFEDGNKRTGRLIANALLLAHGFAPLSYRSVDEHAYREALLVFYELNSLVAFKELFVEQYDFSARNYAL